MAWKILPAAIGMPMMLYTEAATKFKRIRLTVILDNLIAAVTSNKSFYKEVW